MKEVLNFEFSEFSLVGIIIIAVVLAIILKVIKIILIRKIANHRLLNYYPLFIVIIWFSFLLWGIDILLQDSIYHMIAILSLAAITLLGMAWFISKDLFAGLVLRFSDNFNTGQSLSIENNEGEITHIGFLGLSMQQKDGTILKIPWSKINGQIYSKGNTDDVSNRQTFSVKLSQKHPLENVQDTIREAVFLSVGSALKKEPGIVLKKSVDHEWHLEITIFAIKPQYVRNIKANVEKALDNIS